jgi:hypothetical protein
VLTAQGDSRVQATGDVGLALLASESGDIRIRAGGAIEDDSAAETVNIETPGRLYLQAGKGIGSFDHLDINTRIGELNARNEDSGQIIVANEHSVKIGEQGVLQLAPESWVVLYAKTGTVDPLNIDNPVTEPIVLLTRLSGLSERALRALMLAAQYEDGEALLSAPDQSLDGVLRAEAQGVAEEHSLSSAMVELLAHDEGDGSVRVDDVIGALTMTQPVSVLRTAGMLTPPMRFSTPPAEAAGRSSQPVLAEADEPPLRQAEVTAPPVAAAQAADDGEPLLFAALPAASTEEAAPVVAAGAAAVAGTAAGDDEPGRAS